VSVYTTTKTIKRMPALGGEEWSLSGLTDITVLMGKNGSGKSVLLRAWRDQEPNAVHYVVPERTGDIAFQPQYIEQEFDGIRRQQFSTSNFVPEYRRRIMTRVHAYFMARGNSRGDAAPLGPPEEIEDLLASLITDFSVELKDSTPPYLLTRLSTSEQVTNVEQLSSGEAQLLTLGLDILTVAAIWEIRSAQQRVILLDEPDAHIHPDLQARFADFLVRVVERYRLQMVVATHSTSLLAALGQFGAARTSVIYVSRHDTDYRAKPFDPILKELAACLGGHVLMGPLFSVPLLLVEGDDDYRIWSQVPRHHVIKLAVIPTNGDEIFKYQLALERILESLRDSGDDAVGFALLDADKSLPEPSETNPQKHIKFLRLACHEAENLFLADEVLTVLGHTWDAAAKLIVARADEFGNKAEFLKYAEMWDRAKEDLKNVINEVSKILDAKNVAWTTRVGVAIGRARPAGHLESLLGVDVVNALWGVLPKPASSTATPPPASSP
jgi:predicted ATPase